MDILCYSHLRWNFVYQRPQHLLSRMARHYRVFYIEEAIFDTEDAYLESYKNTEDVWVVVPHLAYRFTYHEHIEQENTLLKEFFLKADLQKFIAWYYTPMAMKINTFFSPSLVIYDCMDELSAFKNAPDELKENEAALFQRADIVFTGGFSLYEAKKNKHSNIHLFPSSIDKSHFEKARDNNSVLPDQENIPFPRIGFYGVIDERMDLLLLAEMAEKKPSWHFIILGPVVKIDPATLPANDNIHYLGQKTYNELPFYISRWTVAMMPFAINESTRYISPTKTPEYLAAGKPVVSTPIYDVIQAYGETGLVHIAGTADEFIKGIEQALNIPDRTKWLKDADAALSENSWDITADKMMGHINTALKNEKKIN